MRMVRTIEESIAVRTLLERLKNYLRPVYQTAREDDIMVKKCSKCGVDNKDEATSCSACGNLLVAAKPVPSVKVVQPITPGVAVGVPTSTVRVTPPGMCFYHTSLRASYVCNRCGRAICRDCAKAYADLVMCPSCYREVAPAVPTAPPPSRPFMPMILSLVAGILTLACALGILLSPALMIFAVLMYLVTGISATWVLILGVLAGFLMIAGALVLYQPGYGTLGGIIVMVSSVAGLLAGGGFIIGFVLGLIGGALSLTQK